MQLLGAVAVGLFLGITVGALAAAGRPPVVAATPEPITTRTVSAGAEPLANTLVTEATGRPLSRLGAGTYEVGTGPGQAVPGKYRSAGPDGGFDACYYARLRHNDGSPADILTNNVTSGPSIFTLTPDDGYVQISGCTFTKV